MEFDQTSVERFIGDYFRERTSAQRLRLEVHYRFWRRFYDSQCVWDSRRGVVEQSEAERIVSVSASPVGAWVVTTGETIFRSRMDVRLHRDQWLIHEVDMQCARCGFKGLSKDCTHCGGTGWMSRNNLASLYELFAAPGRTLDTESEMDGGQVLDLEVGRFMAEHFRERTLAQKQEFEILAAFAPRFCSQQFDWARWGPSLQGGQSEQILKIVLLRVGAHVVSSGMHGLRSRYRLRPAKSGWRIQEVDTECPNCRRNGPKSNCFWCGGTIWDRKRANTGQDRFGIGGDELPTDLPRW